MNDVVALSLVVVAFAVVLTAHIAIAHGLARRRPRWHALVAFVVFPLAPYWALRERLRIRAALWTVGVLVYATVSVLQVA